MIIIIVKCGNDSDGSPSYIIDPEPYPAGIVASTLSMFYGKSITE
jgi:hypothetical protein